MTEHSTPGLVVGATSIGSTGRPGGAHGDGTQFNISSSAANNNSNSNTNASSGSSGSSSKNLSHVPCKFFRQGICQAGQSCPFSHNLQGSLAADKLPCKYFQKGNCKFGLKCALAHFLPDGTRINGNVLRKRKYDYNTGHLPEENYNLEYHEFSDSRQNQKSQILLQNHPQNHSQSQILPQMHSHHPQTQGYAYSYNDEINTYDKVNSYHSDKLNFYQSDKLNSYPEQVSYHSEIWNGQEKHLSESISLSNSLSGSRLESFTQENSLKFNPMLSPPNSARFIRSVSMNNGANSGYHSANNYQFSQVNNQFAPLSVSWTSPTNTTNQSSASWATASTTPTNPIDISLKSTGIPDNENFVPNKYRLNSNSNYPFSVFSNNTTSTSTPHSIFTKLPEEAIIDDDYLHENDSEEDILSGGDLLLQDYVPGSLSDIILTPDELQRRDSRSQSGTLLVRPNFDPLNDSFKKNKVEEVFLMD